MTNQQPDFSNENFEELFNQSVANINSFNSQLVKGKIIQIENDYVIVDVGLKSEGRIPKSEFINEDGDKQELKIGDIIEIYIDRYESKDGSIVLSKERAYREENWCKLEIIYQEGSQVEGFVTKRVKGGFMVLVKNTVAFLPGSQLDIRPIKNVNSLVETTQMLKILSMDRKRYNIVVSRRAVIEERLKEEGVSLNKKFTEGQIVEGVVKNITGYGCFLDLGSRDGLLHIIDVSWSRINHPSEVLKVGQLVKVKIIKINPENDRISLGMKQITEDPWINIDKKYTVGSKFDVTITNKTDYGYFAELEKGIEGLIHVSEVSWGKNVSTNDNNLFKVGDKTEAIILDIDVKKRRISLSIKQCSTNPWVGFAEKYPVGSVLEGTVKLVDDTGITVKLTEEIQGFIRNYDISWDNQESVEEYKNRIDQNIKIKILKYDLEREKVYLGVKQLEEDPFVCKIENLKKGVVVNATVTEVTDNMLSVKLENDVSAVIKKNELSLDKEYQKTSNFKVGDTVTAMVVNIDKNERSIGLSIKALEQLDQKKYLSEQENVSVTVGDILSNAINKK